MLIKSTIGEVCKKLQTGKTPPSKEKKYFNGGVNWYTPTDLNKRLLEESKRTITALAYEDKKAIKYPKGTVLLSCIGDIGKVGITTDNQSSSNQQITGLIPDVSKITSEYLYYWCRKHKSLFESKSTSVTVPMLNNKRLSKIKISYEKDLNKQKKIANLLTQVETLIAKREESIVLLDALLRSSFLDMFGDPVLNTKDWKIKPLKKFGKIITGNTPPRKESIYYDEEYIEWIKTDNIHSKKMFLSTAKEYLSEKGLKKGRLGKDGALLVTCIAGSIKSIGNASLTNRNITFNQQINAIQPNEDVNSYFLYWLFRLSKLYIQNQAGKGMKKMITKSSFEKITFPLPPKPLQDKFATIVKQVESTKEQYQKSLDELRHLFGSLSQRAFRGELDFKDKKKVSALDFKVGLGSSVANVLSVASKIQGVGVKLPKLGIDTSSLGVGLKIAEDIAKLDAFKVSGISSLVGEEYNALHKRLSSFGRVKMSDIFPSISAELTPSFMTSEQFSKNLFGNALELEKYTKSFTSNYFETWRKEEEDRLSNLIARPTLGLSSSELWKNKISDAIGSSALSNLESVYGVNSAIETMNMWKDENERLQALQVPDYFKVEQEKFEQLAGLGKYDEHIRNFTKEHESLFNPPSSAFDASANYGAESIKEFSLKMENLGLETLEKSFEVAQPYKLALEQVEAMNPLRDWGERHEALINKYSEKVEETTEVIESILNLSELMDDELFDDIFWTDSYDDIKELVYKLLDEGKLEQVFNEDKKRVVLKKVEQ